MNGLLPADEQYFRNFAPNARTAGVALEDHYMLIQKSLRNEKGGVSEMRSNELHGLQLALTFMGPNDTSIVLGCGNGSEAGWLIQHGIDKSRLTGLDIAEALLANCEKNLGIKTVCGDMRKTGLPDKSYDNVITHRSLHHLFYPFNSLEEYGRIARKRVMILNEPVRSRLKTATRVVKKQRLISAANIYEYQFDRDDVHRYMAFNGFKLAKAIRYWEVPRSVGLNRILNVLARPFGNRFSAIYERVS